MVVHQAAQSHPDHPQHPKEQLPVEHCLILGEQFVQRCDEVLVFARANVNECGVQLVCEAERLREANVDALKVQLDDQLLHGCELVLRCEVANDLLKDSVVRHLPDPREVYEELQRLEELGCQALAREVLFGVNEEQVEVFDAREELEGDQQCNVVLRRRLSCSFARRAEVLEHQVARDLGEDTALRCSLKRQLVREVAQPPLVQVDEQAERLVPLPPEMQRLQGLFPALQVHADHLLLREDQEIVRGLLPRERVVEDRPHLPTAVLQVRLEQHQRAHNTAVLEDLRLREQAARLPEGCCIQQEQFIAAAHRE